MDADFVIISYECNFWGLAALDTLVDSLEHCGIDRDVYVIHNGKPSGRIDHFKAHGRALRRSGAVHHWTAYDDVFEQVENVADFPDQGTRHVIVRHGLVLNWLIKYRLPEGRYVFLDHDCIVRPRFAAKLADELPALAGKHFAFPRHDQEPRSLTGPLFYCDTAVRKYVGGLCDVGWASNVVCRERARLAGGGEVYYTDDPVERAITREHFDDTLHNVVRHILARWPALVDRLAVVTWQEVDHVWHGATRHLERDQIALLRALFESRFRREFFTADTGRSEVFGHFLARLEQCGLAAEFRARFLEGRGKDDV
jgi:hypothetical protein